MEAQVLKGFKITTKIQMDEQTQVMAVELAQFDIEKLMIYVICNKQVMVGYTLSSRGKSIKSSCKCE